MELAPIQLVWIRLTAWATPRALYFKFQISNLKYNNRGPLGTRLNGLTPFHSKSNYMPTRTSNLERLALEGPISLPLAVAIALVLLALFTVSLGMERRILGNRYTAIFWLLRATALGVAVWMLLDPTRVLVEVSTTRTSVALLMDVSGSMQSISVTAPSAVSYSVSRISVPSRYRRLTAVTCPTG